MGHDNDNKISSKNLSAYEVLSSGSCVGCSACISICPKKALSFAEDKYGYYVPQIDLSLCNRCGVCQKICPALSQSKLGQREHNRTSPSLWAVKVNNIDILKESTSGGIFTYLASEIIDLGGVVVGAAWTEDLTVKHILVDNKNDLSKLRKSKYMQSYPGNIFNAIKECLDDGMKVLFSGCPCQVAGLYSFLRKDYQNLYTVDLLCGNAPSKRFFQMYLKESFKDMPVSYEFRNKKYGLWYTHTVQVTNEVGDEIAILKDDDIYQMAYHPHLMCPIHCEKCKFQSLPRYGDITIGDFWGLRKKEKDLFVDDGISAVLINNDRGDFLFNSINESVFSIKKLVPLSWLGGNGYALPGKHNYSPPSRDRFYRAIAFGESFNESFEHATRVPTEDEIVNMLKGKLIIYTHDTINFVFCSYDWEEHHIFGDTYMFPRRIKSPNNKNAWIILDKSLNKDKTYRVFIKFKVSTTNDYVSFFVMDSVVKNRQLVFKHFVHKTNSEDYVSKEFVFTAKHDCNSFVIAASQFYGDDPWFALSQLIIYEDTADLYSD